jgi:putative acetyltransferase
VSVLVRAERPEDREAIHRVNAAAFDTDAEARLVDALRAGGGLVLSLVAEAAGEGASELVGHIAFSPVTVTRPDGTTVQGVGLAPMAVVPRLQGLGIGGRLIAEGLRRLGEAGHRFCVVVGYPAYYPRHGFAAGRAHGLAWERPVPDEVFMVQALVPGGLDGVTGVVRYRGELDAV